MIHNEIVCVCTFYYSITEKPRRYIKLRGKSFVKYIAYNTSYVLLLLYYIVHLMVLTLCIFNTWNVRFGRMKYIRIYIHDNLRLIN